MNQKFKISLEDVEAGDLKAAWALFAQNNWWESRNTFTKASKKGSIDSRVATAFAISLYKTGDIDEGISLLNEVFEVDPSNVLRLGFGLILVEERRYQEALKIIDGVKWLDSEWNLGVEIEAIALIQLDRIGEAVPLLEAVSRATPSYVIGQFSYGLALAYTGNYKRGQETLVEGYSKHLELGDIVMPLGIDTPQYEAVKILADKLLIKAAECVEAGKALTKILELTANLFMRRDDTVAAVRLLKVAVENEPTAENHLMLAKLMNSIWDFDEAEKYARASVELSSEGSVTGTQSRNLLADTITGNLHYRDKRIDAQKVPRDRGKLDRDHLRSITYPGIAVLYTQDLYGGGIRLAGDYLDFVRDRYGRVEDLYEWCAGPGYLGYAMLAHNLTNKLCLSDINPKAVHYAQKTRQANCLEKRVNIYLSNNMNSIPEHEKWDLVIGNPPHYGGSSDYFSEIDRRGWDKDWHIHRHFFEKVGSHLKPNGELCIIEWEDDKVDHASNPELFRPMLEDNGLFLVDAITCKEIADHYYLIARKK